MRYRILAVFFMLVLASPLAALITVHSARPPAAFGPVPTKAQIAWLNTPVTLYLRFGMSTFTGHETTGGEVPRIFNPTALDVAQWIKVAQDAGAQRLILTVKDHDGFCLWPSKVTDYSVKKSSWKKGAGDLVKEFTDACHAANIQAGFYLSAEDRHNKTVGTPEYDAYYTAQLKELLYNYGAVAEIRFDGAGGESAGALPSFSKDAQAVLLPYDWKSYFTLARALQPNAILVSNRGPDARWNGNNIGHCGEPNWAIFDPEKIPALLLNDKSELSYLNSGEPAPGGKIWCPAETFIRDRPSWYWRAAEDPQVLDLDKLVNAYCKSAGRNSAFMLNVPINDKGLIPDADAKRLHEFRAVVDGMFKTNLAAGKKITASSFRANDAAYAPELVLDGDPSTYWATDDSVINGSSLEIDLGKPTQFNMSTVSEYIPLGQRVDSYRIEIPDAAGKWKAIVNGKGIGHLKIERFAAVTASKVRLVIEKGRACPTIAEFALYKYIPLPSSTPKGNP